jgi:DNA-binding MarR family transcriptional regulator
MKPNLVTSTPAENRDPDFTLEKYLPFRLTVLSNRMTRSVARIYGRHFGLSAPEWRAMAVLGHYGAMTANHVVTRTTMDKVRVSRAVARLLAAGYITRQSDPEDRRRAILALTASGMNIYHQVVPLVMAVEEELLAGLNREERATLDRVLAKLEHYTPALPESDEDSDEA